MAFELPQIRNSFQQGNIDTRSNNQIESHFIRTVDAFNVLTQDFESRQFNQQSVSHVSSSKSSYSPNQSSNKHLPSTYYFNV